MRVGLRADGRDGGWESGGQNPSEQGAEPGCLLIAPSPPPDGAYLAVGSHDNLVYVYTVDQGGRKVSRLGKCTVSGQWPPVSPRRHPIQGVQN